MADILERGNIYFFYRPRVQARAAEGIEDIQRFYMVLSPQGERHHRLVIAGQKRLPEIRDGGQRQWAYVARVTGTPAELEDEVERQEYGTRTRGERERPAARPAGEGVYAIARHDDHTHLAYALELPEEPGEVQRELGIREEGSYILSVKNPDVPAPPGAGLRPRQKADFPRRLQERFGERRFIAADPPDLLNYEGAELLLIGAAEDVSEVLGIRLDPRRETEQSAEIFTQLKLERAQHPVEPLFTGEWR